MELGAHPLTTLSTDAPNDLFKGCRPEAEQKVLREEMRQRLHPISCRICRQELSYLRDVGRFPLEENEVQNAYHAGRGYRFLLTVWWGRVVDHLPRDLKEMPAVSSYYRHMSFHLGIRTEREPVPEEIHAASQSGAFSAPIPAAKFPVVIPVPVPAEMMHPSIALNPRAYAAEDPAPRGERGVMRMAKTMSQLSDLTSRPASPAPSHAPRTPSPSRDAQAWLGRAARDSSGSGGYATRNATASKKRRKD